MGTLNSCNLFGKSGKNGENTRNYTYIESQITLVKPDFEKGKLSNKLATIKTQNNVNQQELDLTTSK